MLNKAICRKCHEQYNDNWTFLDDLDWDGTFSIMKGMGEKKPCVRYYAALTQGKEPRKIPINQGVPTDCPFHLEQVMAQTSC